MVPKVTEDGSDAPNSPALWKLHGDVARPAAANWVFPYEEGVVFRSLISSLAATLRERRPPAYALIVGYSESEPAVADQLIRWLEQHVKVLRVRPTWPAGDDNGVTDTARRFFEKLRVYMELEQRAGTRAA